MDIRKITFGYSRHKPPLFNKFDLSLRPGRIYGLLGPNGAGKTTLLYLMSGLLTPAQGQVVLDGMDMRQRRPSTLREIFIVPDEFELPAVSLHEYISTNSCFYPRFSHDIMNCCLATFGMTADVRLDSLSLGQRKKVFMSFAMATRTRVLLMDEPTNGLDIPSKRQFRTFLREGLAPDRLIVVSTHQVKDVEAVLDQILLVDRSEVICNISAAEVVKAQTATGDADGAINLESYFENIMVGREVHHD